MKAENWLYNYKYPEGIRKSLYGLIRRASFINESDTAYKLFLENHSYLNECYQLFFPDVKQFAKQKFEELFQ
jgi:acyl carrier protein phosphodiesterase